MSAKQTLHHLHALDASYWEGSATALLPNVTIEGSGCFDRHQDAEGLPEAAGLKQFPQQQLAAVGAKAKATGSSVEATLHDADLTADAGYQPMVIPFVMSSCASIATRRAWAEATGHFTRAD